MTNEFAIKVLTELKGYGDKFANIGYDRKQALDLAIKALEQQPCEDCISREEVIEALRTWIQYGHLPNGDYVPLDYLSNPEEYVAFVRFEDAETCINEMPSVTPARPKGKWIEVDDVITTCSNCGKSILTAQNWFLFCPCCGADMRGDEYAKKFEGNA